MALRTIASLTVSMKVTSRQVCQPGLRSRWPTTRMPRGALAQRQDRVERALQRLRAAADAGVVLHGRLQLLVEVVGVLAIGPAVAAVERVVEQVLLLSTSRSSMVASAPAGSRELGRGDARTPAEHEDVAERVAAEPVGAVQAAGHLAGRVQAGHRGRRRLGVDAHATHGVVDGRAHLHRRPW